MIKVIILIVLYLNSSYIISQQQTSCTFTNGMKEGICKGFVEQSIAMRNDLKLSNKGCANNQVFFYPNKASSEVKCAECIPSQYLVNSGDINNEMFSERITICKYTRFGRKCSSPKATPLELQCPVGSYCDNGGKCTSLTKHKMRGEKCSEVTHSASPKNQPIKRICGFDGLQCISGKCQVCENGREYTNIGPDDYKYLSETPIFSRSGSFIRQRKFCLDGQLYPTKYDFSMLNEPYSVFVLIFAIIIVIIVIARDFMRFKNTKLAYQLILKLKLRYFYKEKKPSKHPRLKKKLNDSDEENSCSEDDDSNSDSDSD
ncbi:hypothetical protein ABK040_014184 [Willaertia magna]